MIDIRFIKNFSEALNDVSYVHQKISPSFQTTKSFMGDIRLLNAFKVIVSKIPKLYGNIHTLIKRRETKG